MVPLRSIVGPLRNVLQTSLQLLLLFCLASVAWGAEMCTKSVPVQREPSKKVHVLRRVPASCSNWEKAWSWITKKDCGTKYRLDLVDIPSQKVVMYRTKKVCCEGDLKCKKAEANGLESAGMDVSDEKFLAIVLGSTAAALFVLILVISISLCRKKKQCTLICEERRHIYANAEDAEESSELQGQKGGCGADDEETENKVCESEYAEINDSGLPRYTDIFKEPGAASHEDPFTRATAPPMCTYETHGAESGAHVPHDPDESNVKEVLQGTADILQRESQQRESQQRDSQRREKRETQQQQQQQQRQMDQDDVISEENDTDYYNVASSPVQGAAAKPPASGDCGAVGEEAVLSLTKDDPAVVTGKASSSSPPSSSSSSPVHPLQSDNSASCDVTMTRREQEEGAEDPPQADPARKKEKNSGSACHYDSLAQRRDKDSHEYQRLISRPAPSDDIEMTEVGEEEEVDVVADEGTSLTTGHVENTASC